MKIIVQRVKNAKLEVNGENLGEISTGLVCFCGFCETDTRDKFEFLARRIAGLRIFEDEAGKMNVNPDGAGADFMIIPNFTLYANCLDGFRPSFIKAMKPEQAKPLFYDFVEFFKTKTSRKVVSGVFGADMQITQHNDGPITLYIEI